MYSLLLAVIYLIFMSLGLPDSLLGSGWPTMQVAFGVSSSYAGYVSMAISFMTIISALISPRMIRRFHTKWIVIVSILLTVFGLFGFSFSTSYAMLFLFVMPYGLGAGAIDASVNHYVANNYSGSVMNFLHCFYGVGAVISPNIMALAYSDNIDRIEVERGFSLAKRCYGLGSIRTKLDTTTRSSIALSIIAMNVDRLTEVHVVLFLISIFSRYNRQKKLPELSTINSFA